MTEKTIHLGDKDGDGYTVEIVRGFEDGTEEYSTTFVKYVCHGVEDVDVSDPWNTGGRSCHIGVYFSTGEREYVEGVITDIDVDQ